MTDCIVLGAGMVGVGAALALQERGWSVLLVDRNNPGSETSYGNAGIIQTEAVSPYALPRAPLELLKAAFGANNQVAWRQGICRGRSAHCCATGIIRKRNGIGQFHSSMRV